MLAAVSLHVYSTLDTSLHSYTSTFDVVNAVDLNKYVPSLLWKSIVVVFDWAYPLVTLYSGVIRLLGAAIIDFSAVFVAPFVHTSFNV